MSKPGRNRKLAAGWRRRSGVIYRPRFMRGWPRASDYSIDGGDDAPLTRRGRVVYRCTLAVVVGAGIGLIIWIRP
ncbi:MAG TPA: hypothetical protein VGP92_06655 [Acidimicrobiia bacterium]|nr:hypothetical protein [Acidimicrobiia bacterium]